MKQDYEISITLLLFTSLVCSQQCNKKEFIPLASEKYSPEEKVSSLGAMSQAQCERACRLTPECGAFLMTSIATSGRGICELYKNIMLSRYDQLGETVLYGSCPDTMEYRTDYGACLRIIPDKQTWYEGKATCENLHPSAHLVALTSELKQSVTDTIIDEYHGRGATYHANAIRKQVGSQTFVWNHTGAAVVYDNWHGGKPNDYNNPDDMCMFVKFVNGRWGWDDGYCSQNRNRYVICEL